MIITVHAGHAAPGNKNCGAVGYCAESYVDRQIKDELIKILRAEGHTVIDCTVDSGLTQSSIITAIKKKINAVPKANFNISIHLNSSSGKHAKDNKTTGTECLINADDNTSIYGRQICRNFETLGFKNRGVKQRTDLGVLKGIKNGGMNILVETFFCNDEDDFLLYSKLGAAMLAQAIADGLMGRTTSLKPRMSYTDPIFGTVDLTPVFNAKYYADHHTDVVAKKGNTVSALFEHFCKNGMKECRQACEEFNPAVYKERYPDLKAAYGSNNVYYYLHWIRCGIKEGRKGV